MKTIIITAVALATAAPAFANEQLARELGVEPGRYTAAELAILKSHASFESNEGRVYLDGARVYTTQGVHNATALSQFRRAQIESNQNGLAD